MKKTITAALLIVGILITLTACNNNSSTTASTPDSANTKDSAVKEKYNPATPGAQNGQ